MSSAVIRDYKSLQADIVIIGSGGGLAAAVTAAEAGARVILLEKENILGGYTRQANSLLACESPVQKRMGINVTVADCLRALMQWGHGRRVDPRIVHAFFSKTAETIAWLESKGVVFELMETHGTLQVTHQPIGNGAAVQKALIKARDKLHIETLFFTSGKKILLGTKDQVNAVEAVNVKTGGKYRITTKAVVIATGGFGDNRELLKKMCPDYYDDMYLDVWPHHEAHSGDGIYMAQEIGAEIADSVPNYHMAPYFHPYMYPFQNLAAMAMHRFAILVNKQGRRFTDETGTLGLNNNAFFRQKDKVCYTLFDDSVRADVEEGGSSSEHGRRHAFGDKTFIATGKYPGLADDLKKEVKKSGRVKMADSWSEIADWIGCNPEVLQQEIEEYNLFCANGCDAIFTKEKSSLKPLNQPPFYAMQCGARVGETLGGIKVNERMEIINTQGHIIKGAYVAGVIADGFQSEDYNHSDLAGSAMGFAVNTGRIAGENAAKYCKGTKL